MLQPTHERAASPPASAPAASRPPPPGKPVPCGPLTFTCTEALQPALTEQLEEEDVMRLAVHGEALETYQATVAAARRAQPVAYSAGARRMLRALGRAGVLRRMGVLVCCAVHGGVQAGAPHQVAEANG